LHELIYTFFFKFVEVIGEQVGEVFQGVLRSPGEPGLARRPVRRIKSTGAREIITSNYISTSSLQTSKILSGPPRGSLEPGFFHDNSWECPHELPICAVFSSPKLKAQVSLSDRLLSGVRLSVRLFVCLSVCLSVCKLLHFRLLLQNR
jgi:hypothetical protein